jgi:tRNA(Ile)-lysidine synthase
MTMQQGLEQRFEGFIESERLLAHGSSVLLAVSGGIDSMTMLRLFLGIRDRWNLTLSVAHLNHGLRGEESDADEALVVQAARTSKLPYAVERVNAAADARDRRMNLQEAARDLRYRFFEATRRSFGADVVATAHHANDNAETVLMNALRGSGVRGLAGIPVKRDEGRIIRPLLFAYRHELELFAALSGVDYRDDPSNHNKRYRRNLVRHTVLPALQKMADVDVAASLNRVGQLMREMGEVISHERDRVISSVGGTCADGSPVLNVERLLALPVVLREEIALTMLQRMNVEPNEQKIRNLLALCHRATGRSMNLSGSLSVYRDRQHLVFRSPIGPARFEARVKVGETIESDDFRLTTGLAPTGHSSLHSNPGTVYVDAEKLGSQFLVRTWREGDWFIPLGMKGRKKISDFFIDAKTALHMKQRTPLLESGGAIVWVCGRRLDERFKVTDRTTSVVQLTFEQRTAAA